MRYLIFDIETAAIPIEEFEKSQQEYITRGCKTEEERATALRNMSLNPLTSRIACIGMLHASGINEPTKGCVYSSGNEPKERETLEDGTVWQVMSEREMLEKFWETVQHGSRHGGYHLISFNGRNFDCPFIMLRSAVLKIRPIRNLMDGTRWRYDHHTDLIEELSFKGGGNGATKRFNFDFYCKAFGIKSPKSDGVTGMDVPRLYTEGEHKTIAEYCMRDVHATWELFKFWKEYLADLHLC